MKPVALTETAAVASPELIPHEWDDSGRVLSPDLVTVDFGKKAGDRAAQFVLGLRADGTWRVGLHLKTKTKAIDEPCQASGHDYVSRAAALRVALGRAINYFGGDKPAVQTLSAFFAKTLGASVADECLTANAPTATSAPLPEAVPMELPVASIQRNPEQPRKDFPADAEQELADSIASVGLLQRIVVRRLLPDELGTLPGMDAPDRYELIAGERRWRAHVRLERTTIKAEVFTGLTRAQAAAPGLVENLQREGLNPIEEAEGYRDLMLKEGLTQEQCAQRVGKTHSVSRSVVANALRVLALPAGALTPIREGQLTMAHGVALARFKPKDDKAAELVPSWAKVIEVMAEEAIHLGLSAAALEKGIPCLAALQRAELAVTCHAHEFDNEYPAVVKKHPAYHKVNDWNYICLEPAHWAGLLKERDDERAAEEKKRKAREAAAAAKKPAKVKSLADLTPDKYMGVDPKDKESQAVLSLLPEASVREVKGDSDGRMVTICTEPSLYQKIERAIAEAKAADRAEKYPAHFRAALAGIHRVKKVGPNELALLFYLAGTQEKSCPPTFGEDSAKACEVKLPKKAFDPNYDGEMLFTGEALTLIRDEVESVKLWRVLVDNWLREFEDEWAPTGWNASATSDLAVLLRWLLGVDTLGLLEETKAGQKQLLKAVKDHPWYDEAIAAIEKGAA